MSDAVLAYDSKNQPFTTVMAHLDVAQILPQVAVIVLEPGRIRFRASGLSSFY